MSDLSVILVPSDLQWPGWEEVLGPVFSTLVMHGSAAGLENWVQTPKARKLLERLKRRNVQVEYAVHLCTELLPRQLFPKHPELFRMDEFGWRTPDANFCPSSSSAARIIEKNLRHYASALKPTTGRYHIFPDDNRPWCSCPKCRKFSPADQVLMFTNILARSLRKTDPKATAGYCAYKPALKVPQKVRPEPNVFVDFAPIERDYRHPLCEGRSDKDRYFKKLAPKLLDFFGAAGSQIIEYWLDASMFSQWQKPMHKIPTTTAVMKADLEYYASLGFENISVIGVWLDNEYVKRFDDSPLRRFVAAIGHKDHSSPKMKKRERD